MSEATTVASSVAILLLLLTAVSSAKAAWRYRDAHHFNILMVVASHVAANAVRPVLFGGLVHFGLLFVQPHLLFRLVQHFRDVPAILRRGSLAFAIIGLLAYAVLGSARPSWLRALLMASVAILYAFAGAAFSQEGRRKAGVTAKRLRFAALGTWIFAALFVVNTTATFVPALSGPGYQVNRILAAAALTCYFLAFSTPRRLRANWQRAEQAKYLTGVAALDPVERGHRASDDLAFAGTRSVGNAVTLVALRDAPHSTDLTVRSSSDPALVGLRIRPTGGVFGRVSRTLTSISDTAEACEPEVASRVRPYGTRVLAAPVATTANTWGVVLVVQRRGSLFPDDDLRLLAELGSYAATALDHAHLIAEARERERRAADRRLREAESQMSMMLDSIKDYAMFVLDEHGRIVTWHLGAQHVFGYSSAEMADQPAGPLFNMTDGEFAALLVRAHDRGSHERDGVCRRRDGGRFIGTTLIRPLEDDADDLRGYVAVTRDVTERRDLEARLRQSQKMEAIGQLAGGIAHDFNNLLTAILGYAEWLGHDLAGDEKHWTQILEIQKAAERAAGLTRQLLAFSRPQMLQPSIIDLSKLVSDLVPMLGRVIGEHIDIVADVTPDLLPVLGDRSQVEQIIVNLAVNARDAMPDGGRLTIRSSNVRVDGGAHARGAPSELGVMLEVVDTGIGMDPATQARIFEPFFTTKEHGRGSGLGLATVYGIVKQMGGAVNVISAPNQGTTFRLYFQETQVRPETALGSLPANTPRGCETLLLVEDDQAVRTYLMRLLDSQGYQVIAAQHQADALDAVRGTRDPIHLVITDVLMPGGTGPELVRALDQIRPGIPALYISGYADDVILKGPGPFARDSHFLQKPFAAADLMSRIRQILSRTT
ncbi:MAG TPA: ATP-binding protein [Vicinamibacterales bacterium]|nr:ATP-binding protein [Vicinamibacterales bacterium]